VTGDPDPKITWFKDGIPIEQLPEPVRRSFKIDKQLNLKQLIISNTDSEMHSGTYRCLASNEYGETDCSCGILVRSNLTLLIYDKF
jgi:hypothetical protein